MQENSIFAASFRLVTGETLREKPLTLLAQHHRDELRPVRVPSAHRKMRHLPGFYWMSKLNDLVSFESRLEMAILMQLDFDPGLSGVLPQPFVLHFSNGGKSIRHIPDYLVWRNDTPPELINVKPNKNLQNPTNQQAFAACAAACSQIGWSYSTHSEPAPDLIANLKWLSGYRRPPPLLHQYAGILVSRAVHRTQLDSLLEGAGPPALVRPVLFHLLWTRYLEFDLTCVLSDTTAIQTAPL